MDEGTAARRFHDATKHTPAGVRGGGRRLDWENKPLPVKVYPDLDPVPLSVTWPVPTVPAAAALSGVTADPGNVPLDAEGLARLLFLSAGVTRRWRRGGQTWLFRAAPSAGALYPVEVYVVCGDLDALGAGVYHFEPAEFALRRLRGGDFRGAVAAASAAPGVAARPVHILLTGIPWRTTWKYGPRGYRHLFWDAGAVAANALVAAASSGWDTDLLTGFVDADVAHLLGVGDGGDPPLREWPLAVLAVGPPGEAPDDPGDVAPVRPAVVPLSREVRDEPDLPDVHDAGNLTTAEEVAAWRERLQGAGTKAPAAVDPPDAGGTVDEVVLRRGSTRAYAHEPVAAGVLDWGVAAAARSVPADVPGPGASLLAHFLAVHAVDGAEAGTYRWRGGAGAELLRPGRFRDDTARVCLEQPLGGDAALTAFHMADLDGLLARGGTRAYRAAQLEAGIAAERLQLAGFALGTGGSGITFYDDEARRFFSTDAEPMLVATLGRPGYRPRPGRPPSELAPLRVEDLLR